MQADKIEQSISQSVRMETQQRINLEKGFMQPCMLSSSEEEDNVEADDFVEPDSCHNHNNVQVEI